LFAAHDDDAVADRLVAGSDVLTRRRATSTTELVEALEAVASLCSWASRAASLAERFTVFLSYEALA